MIISIYNEYKSINVVFCINFPPTKSLVIYLSRTPKPRAASFRVLSSDLWPAATRLDPAASALWLRPSRQTRSRTLSLSNNHIFTLHFEMIFWSITELNPYFRLFFSLSYFSLRITVRWTGSWDTQYASITKSLVMLFENSPQQAIERKKWPDDSERTTKWWARMVKEWGGCRYIYEPRKGQAQSHRPAMNH